MKKVIFIISALALALVLVLSASTPPTGRQWKKWSNPLFEGWYADPEGIVIDGQLWIYPTYSKPFKEQLHLDAFSSKDLKKWTKHERIISNVEIAWLKEALWAPSIVQKDGKFYLFFSCNNIRGDKYGGIGVAVADSPAGPFKDLLGKPLIGEIINNAQPIDQYVFQDPTSGNWYMYYGGWRRCNMVRLSDDFTSLIPFEDGQMVKEVTPKNYVEGPFMFVKDGKYYFMWSEGNWTKDNYCVAYAISDSPFGPFVRENTILESDTEHGTGAGHHSVVRDPKSGEYLIVYHRHPIGATDGNNRVTCIDRLEFDAEGKILPVKMH